MNICRIISIKPDGQPWGEPPNGPYYPFYLTFADGAAGQANAKSNPPQYKVGDEVGYEYTGTKTPRGVPKLKIDRKADPTKYANTTPQDSNPDLEAAPQRTPPRPHSATQNAPTVSGMAGNVVHGATACWAVGKAVELVIAGKEQNIEEAARALLAIQQRIEKGEAPTESEPPF